MTRWGLINGDGDVSPVVVDDVDNAAVDDDMAKVDCRAASSDKEEDGLKADEAAGPPKTRVARDR
jgi:hypothetical protein